VWEPHGAAGNEKVKTMMIRTSIAIAAGLLLTAPAFAEDTDTTPDTAQGQKPDATHANAGLGTQVHQMAQDQQKGDATNGVGEQVRTMARHHGCEVNGSPECAAHHAVQQALAEKAGAPTDHPAMPGAAGDHGAATHPGTRDRAAEAERAAMRHTERAAMGGDVDDMHSNGHRAGHGDGHGMGDGMMQGAETKRSGDAHPMGSGMGGSGSGTGGGMGGGGMH
jgi:hypothetical protein